jgi:hypothetical protein
MDTSKFLMQQDWKAIKYVFLFMKWKNSLHLGTSLSRWNILGVYLRWWIRKLDIINMEKSNGTPKSLKLLNLLTPVNFGATSIGKES